MRKPILLLTLSLLFFIKAYGQQFYTAGANGGIQSVSISNGVPSIKTITFCATTPILGIAMHGKSFYYITLSPPGSALYKADINNDVISNCTLLANLSGSPNALTVDNGGILYYVGGDILYKIDSNNPVPVTLGTLPFTSGGDLAFYNNDLYMASPNSIVKIDLDDPSQSTVYIQLNLGKATLYGLTAVSVNNMVQFYAFSSPPMGSQTDVIALDMANQTVIGTLCTLSYVVADAASLVESGTTTSIQIDTVYTNQICSLNDKGQVQIEAKPDITNATLTYTLNSTTNTTALFSDLSPGNYPVHIASSSGTQKDTVIVVPDYRFDKTTVSASKTNPVCNNAGKIQLIVANSSLYTTQYNGVTYAANHNFTGLPTGDYNFTLSNQSGCPVDTVNITLTQDICYPTITFPNAFTPNNDGINDIFEPDQDGNATNYTLTIYNRWGLVIFVSNDFHTGWDGQYKGKPAAVGTYYWIANYTAADGKKNTQSGYVTLIR